MIPVCVHFTDFHDAWWFLCSDCEEEDDIEISKAFQYYDEDINLYTSYFHRGLCIEVQKVNPETGCIDDNTKLNTKTEIWLECGEPYWNNDLKTILNYHNLEYDTGGDTFEEAIINLANIIWTKEKVIKN